MNPHIIIDLETLDTRPTGVITEIGAIVFDPADYCFIESVGIDLDIAEQLAMGRTFSPDTIHHRRRNRTLDACRFTASTVRESTAALDLLIAQHKPELLWIWGKDFDGPFLDNLFCMADLGGFRIPYYNRRCARDRYKLAFGESAKGTAKPHSALKDCEISLLDLKEANARIRIDDSKPLGPAPMPEPKRPTFPADQHPVAAG